MNSASSRRSLSGFLASLLLVTSLFAGFSLLPSCSKGAEADIEDLLLTVPSDASAIAAINIRSILEKLDCRIEGSTVTPGKEMAEMIAKSDGKKELTRFFKGDYGIDPSVAIVFAEGADLYLSGYLADPSKFKSEIEKEGEEKFSTADGVECAGNIAVKGTRFWVCLSHNNVIKTAEIARFTSLSEKLSYMSVGNASELADLDHDIKGGGNIAGILNVSPADFTTRSMIRMTLEALFADAEGFAFHADFDKGKMVSEVSLLTEKGSPAKFLFPTGRVDIGAIKQAGESADIVIAAGLSQKMIKQLQQQIGSKGISMFNVILQSFSSVDGTCVALVNNEGKVSGFFTTTGDGTSALSDLLTSTGMKVTKDGKLVRFSNDPVTGLLNVAEVSDMFKGALAGAVLAPSAGLTGTAEGIADYAFMLAPGDGTVRLKITANAIDPSQNILFSFIK